VVLNVGPALSGNGVAAPLGLDVGEALARSMLRAVATQTNDAGLDVEPRPVPGAGHFGSLDRPFGQRRRRSLPGSCVGASSRATLRTVPSRERDTWESVPPERPLPPKLTVFEIGFPQEFTRDLRRETDPTVVHERLAKLLAHYDVINYELRYDWIVWRARRCNSAEGFQSITDLIYPPPSAPHSRWSTQRSASAHALWRLE
jgi:hypothetical protein